jgi:hypothetical protein
MASGRSGSKDDDDGSCWRRGNRRARVAACGDNTGHKTNLTSAPEHNATVRSRPRKAAACCLRVKRFRARSFPVPHSGDRQPDGGIYFSRRLENGEIAYDNDVRHARRLQPGIARNGDGSTASPTGSIAPQWCGSCCGRRTHGRPGRMPGPRMRQRRSSWRFSRGETRTTRRHLRARCVVGEPWLWRRAPTVGLRRVMPLVAAAASVAAAGCGGATCSPVRDVQRYRHAPDRPEEVRYRAAIRLVDCRDLIGVSKGEVRRLLGKPEEIHRGRWFYGAGYAPDSFGPLIATLAVSFDRGGRVRAAAVSPTFTTFP